MVSTLVEAFELLVHAEQLGPRLAAAATALAQLPDLDNEASWLAAARARLACVATMHGALLDRALRHKDLASLKTGERGKNLQAAVADELERLQAAIIVAAGARSPLLETLFPDLKVPAVRKCTKAELERCGHELERRLASSYARRLLASERYAPVVPVVHSFRTALGLWASVFVDPPLEGAAADTLRDELLAAARAIELPIRQARLLAQAALLPAQALLDAAGVMITKPKRGVSDSHPLLEKDPPDPLLPTPDERAEIDELHGAS